LDETERLRYRLSNLEDQINYEMREAERKLNSKIESVHEEIVTYEEFEDLRLELLERQNRMFRAIARELRKLNGKKKEG